MRDVVDAIMKAAENKGWKFGACKMHFGYNKMRLLGIIMTAQERQPDPEEQDIFSQILYSSEYFKSIPQGRTFDIRFKVSRSSYYMSMDPKRDTKVIYQKIRERNVRRILHHRTLECIPLDRFDSKPNTSGREPTKVQFIGC